MSAIQTHIVAIRLSALGDVAMTVPIIRALTQQHSNVKLTIVSRPFFKPFFDNIPNVDFFTFDDKNRHKGTAGLVRLYSDIHALNPDAFIDLHNVIRTKFLRFLFGFTGVKVASICKGRLAKKEITQLANKIFRQTETVFEKQQKAFISLGFQINLSLISFPTKAFLSPTIQHEFNLKNDGTVIGIAPFAQYQSKVYPIDLMQKFIDLLSINPTVKILLFGGGTNEILLLKDLSKNKKNVIVVAGKVSFREEIDIISHLDAMLSMDSGNAHIAAMLGIPVVTLWGATHPFAGFNPFNQPTENAITSDREKYPMLPTSVYGNRTVLGYEDAMRTILPAKIVARVNDILHENSKYKI